MVFELAELVRRFSVEGRVRCFTHILNLVSRQLLKPFDVTKKPKGEGGDGANDGGSEVLDKLLSSLAKDLDIEEETMELDVLEAELSVVDNYCYRHDG